MDASSSPKLPVPSTGKPTQSGYPLLGGSSSRPLLSFAMSSVGATIAARMLPHIDAQNDANATFLCTSAVLLNVSAAISTVALTALRIELDFGLSRVQGLGRMAVFLYLNWFACTIGGIACLIALLLPYGNAIFRWT